jgi:hypothetical protein
VAAAKKALAQTGAALAESRGRLNAYISTLKQPDASKRALSAQQITLCGLDDQSPERMKSSTVCRLTFSPHRSSETGSPAVESDQSMSPDAKTPRELRPSPREIVRTNRVLFNLK